MNEIYLDYNASAPLDSRAAQVMIPVLMNEYGNAASTHNVGRRLKAMVEDARMQIGTMVGENSHHVVFTAGATEANNLALRGNFERTTPGRTTLLISAVEHASVSAPANWIDSQKLGKVCVIPVTRGGFVDLSALESMMNNSVKLVSVMAANSETGILNPLSEISRLAKKIGALFHCDATQYVGRLPFNMNEIGADLVSVSSHKICGPAGVGAIIGTKQSLKQLTPIIFGGGHEQGLRSGSLFVAGIIGFGVAAQIVADERINESTRVAELRDHLVASLKKKISAVYEVGDCSRRLPNTANIRFENADGEAVVVNMHPVIASVGSACSSGSIEPSSVLQAMGISREAAYESIRFSLGRFTTRHEIDTAVEKIKAAVEFVRRLNGKAA